MYAPLVYIIERKCLNGSVENAEAPSRKETTPMMVPPPNPYYEEIRMKERIANRDLTIPKFSRRAALAALAIVLIVTIGGIILLYTLH